MPKDSVAGIELRIVYSIWIEILDPVFLQYVHLSLKNFFFFFSPLLNFFVSHRNATVNPTLTIISKHMYSY